MLDYTFVMKICSL